MNFLYRLIFVLFIVTTALHSSTAQEVTTKPSPFRFLISVAGEFGGDKIAVTHFTDGQTQSMPAGQGVSIAVGGQYQIPKAEKFLLRGTVGFKYITTMASNANIRLTRVPVIFSANYMAAKKLRLSAGLTSHQGIQFNADGLGEDAKFKSAAGPIFEIAYHGIGLTYTAMTYKDSQNASYSANSIGVSLSTTIGKKGK
ncbi:hypothetical protein GZH53_01630 [Flavihumibacter sp. R14]|nr:hypothetical protein [Flavihumibacter soli]